MKKFRYNKMDYEHGPLFIIFTLVQCIALIIALFLGLRGFPVSDYNVMIMSALFLWIACVFYCFKNISERALLLLFDFVIFVFLMCRPVIDVIKGATRWHYYAEKSVYFAILSVVISLILLQIGSYFCERFFAKESNRRTMTLAPSFVCAADFRFIALILYLICMIFFFAGELDKLIYMQGRSYTEFYTGYTSSLPGVFYTISKMMPYALCVYLATLPKKKHAFLPLVLYVLSAVPQLLIGIRNPIVLNVIFAFIYYIVRDCMGDEKKWLGKLEKGIIIVCAPLAAFGLSVMNYLRAGNENPNGGFLGSIVDLFYKQGVSFDVLCMAHKVLPILPGGTKCYTFGPFIDGITQGRIGQTLFNVSVFPSGNSAVRAIEGHTFAHCMSYVAHPDYLSGSGWGSSYVLETFADFGWLGLGLYSFLMGIFLVFAIRGLKRGWFLRIVLLTILMQLMFTPRAEAVGWMAFIVSIHFWFVVVFCVFMSGIFKKIDMRKVK